ncbi:helix-turn-helix domain-containing protein [Burkholderia sp. Ac-20379]|uniref:helix-turn-helix domain-containing protein n=1 Tax=Burkholderia sp. Ac-20379 TaxID=2703900 RepID=UPI00197F9A0B|nr:helix-turn-helix transcriptional regulator [Burkholderia sp. Ac-20379]MBN3725750.1 helix-turn-helix transcriptional regulator [Burkholderia sp. Ac-20379]
MARHLPKPVVTSPLAADLIALGNVVRNRRREQSMRIDDAAALLGVSTAMLSRMENGIPVGSDRMFRVLDGLGLNLFAVPKAEAPNVIRALQHGDAGPSAASGHA